jgi:hypothetical protein
MTVVVDRKGSIVAAFAHWSDCVQFVQANLRHGYETTQEPELDHQIAVLMAEPKVIEDARDRHSSR